MIELMASNTKHGKEAVGKRGAVVAPLGKGGNKGIGPGDDGCG